MSETINIEQAVLNNLRMLSNQEQQEVLDFAQFLAQKAGHRVHLNSKDVNFSISATEQLSLQEIAKLPVAARHQILAPFMAETAEDFLNDPELTEFSVLDREDWDPEND